MQAEMSELSKTECGGTVVFPSHARIFGEGSTSHLVFAQFFFLFLKLRLAHAHQFHFLGQDQPTVAKQAETTVAKPNRQTDWSTCRLKDRHGWINSNRQTNLIPSLVTLIVDSVILNTLWMARAAMICRIVACTNCSPTHTAHLES